MVRRSDLPAAAASTLLGPWNLESVQEPDGSVKQGLDPTGVTADFRPDGRFEFRAGHNQYNAVFRMDRGELIFDTRSTLTTRGSAPQDLRYITLLDTEPCWRSTVDDASLELRSDGGTWRFRR